MMRKRAFLFSVCAGVSLFCWRGVAQADVSVFEYSDNFFLTNTHSFCLMPLTYLPISLSKLRKFAGLWTLANVLVLILFPLTEI